jgi:hypothetical protein
MDLDDFGTVVLSEEDEYTPQLQVNRHASSPIKSSTKSL